MEYRDYYKLLGVERNSNAESIRRAYRKLAMIYHPDRNPGNRKAEDKFKDITEAYEVLSDAPKRLRYDRLGEAYTSWRRKGGTGSFNWEAWVEKPRSTNNNSTSATTSAAASRKNKVVKKVVEDLDEKKKKDRFSDFFNLIFGSANREGQTRRSSKKAAPYYEHPVKISLEEAYRGTERTLQVEGRLVRAAIPSGANTGTRLPMPGAGPKGADGKKMDLHLIVQVLPDPGFDIKEDDLHTEVEIDIYTAVLGGEVKVPAPEGAVFLTIPPGTQPGQTFRLLGRGMPRQQNSTEYGNMYVQVKVQIPHQLTSRQKSLFEKLRKT